MDAAHRQEMEMWMKETNEKKFEYIAAVDTRELKIDRELNENQRVRDEYLAKVWMLIDTARIMMARIDNPNTVLNPQPGPRNVAAGIPPVIKFDTAFGFDGQGSFDGTAQSIPSQITVNDDVSDVTSVSKFGGAAGRGTGAGRVANAHGDGDDQMLLRRLEEMEARIRRMASNENPNMTVTTQPVSQVPAMMMPAVQKKKKKSRRRRRNDDDFHGGGKL